MARYLFIESRSPFESNDVGYVYALANDLVDYGNEVTLYLVQNGVLPARKGAKDVGLDALSGKVRVLADDFSLAERAIAADGLVGGIGVGDVGLLVDLLADGVKAVWH